MTRAPQSVVTRLIPQAPVPPFTKSVPVTECLHGVEVVDPYRWLEDQQSPETRSWLAEQAHYTEQVVGPPSEREELRRRLEQLTRIESVTMPTARNGRWFYYKRAADQEHFVYCMRHGPDGEETVLLDPHTMSSDLSVTAAVLDVSHDGNIVVFGLREGGEDELEIRLLDVPTRAELPDRLPKARYLGASLTRDKSTLYYGRAHDEGCRIYAHPIAADACADLKVFGDGYGPGVGIGAHVSEDGRWLVLVVWHGSAAKKTEVYLKDLAADGPIVPVVADIDARFDARVVGDRLYLHTDWEAPNGRLLVADPTTPDRANWTELVPERESVLDAVSYVGGRLFLRYLQEAVSVLHVLSPDGVQLGEIRGPSLGTLSAVAGRWSGDEGFYAFSSYNVPPRIYRHVVSTGATHLWHQAQVPFDGDAFEVSQVWFASKDGTRVPMFVFHRRGLALDGSAPALLTGYGGFAISASPSFAAGPALWVERGGVFAVANLRGGGEFGEKWHEAGMMDRKQNVFDDFIAAAEYLVREGYTSPDRLAIQGGSNGGLLVGAALTQRPELFRAVHCSCPLLDMVRYHRFLQASYWVSEYGSAEDPAQFRYLLAYSPYHNVRDGVAYPAVLFTTGDADTRVDPLHARKMCALLQAATRSGRPVALQYDTRLGHSGGQPATKQVDDLALSMAFLMREVGIPFGPCE